MPSGYLVQLGDGSLDVGDAIVDGLTTFATDTVLGNGQWIWSGTWSGTTFTDELEPGQYVLGTDGNVYFVPAFGPVDTLTSSTVVSAPAYDPENVVDGTTGDDVIDAAFTDTDGDAVDDGTGTGAGGLDDRINADDGDDSISAGAGDDLVYGGDGQDTIDGGTGDDTIYGDSVDATSQTESLSWTAEGNDGQNIAGGITQSTGQMNVSVSFASDGNNNPTFRVETTDTNYVGSGEPFDPNSSAFLFASGDGASSTTTVVFSTEPDSGVQNEVKNVEFRINDIDWAAGNHQDIVTINAFDQSGAPVTVTITPGGGDTASGNTITAETVGESSADLGGSALIQIAGPVARIEIAYSNGQSGSQGINVTDIFFDTIPISGDDVIAGGTGADTIFAGSGDDIITVAEGDVADGGDGDDTFLVTDLGESGSADITIIGGEGDEVGGDTLDFRGVVGFGSVTYTNSDPAAGGGLSGFAALADGSVVNFSEIENVIICFAAGTRILTPQGERLVETLRPGDMVLTADSGLQPIRWAGKRTVPGRGKLAPIRIAQGTFLNQRDLLVSPQHRMLIKGWNTQMLFGENEVLAAATHLVDDRRVTRQEQDEITYVHLLFDQHEVIFAEGAPSESFHPGQVGMDGILAPAREELFQIFPELRSNLAGYGPTSRMCLRGHEAKALMAA